VDLQCVLGPHLPQRRNDGGDGARPVAVEAIIATAAGGCPLGQYPGGPGIWHYCQRVSKGVFGGEVAGGYCASLSEGRSGGRLMKLVLRFVSIWLAAAVAFLPPASAQEPAPFKKEEIEQMVAPIALYPDSLIAQILMACTYPLEVVEAARWVKSNPNVK